MKLWEAIKELTEDPTKVFESKVDERGWRSELLIETGCSRYFRFNTYDGSERLIDQSCSGGAFNGNVALNGDWQLVRDPITWQEAIRAWSVGKIVSVEVGGCVYRLTHDDSIFGLSQRMITLGEWYLEG